MGYSKLDRDAFVEPNEGRRSISGTIAILFDFRVVCGVDDDERRSLDERSRGRSWSRVSRSLLPEVVELVLRDDLVDLVVLLLLL